MTHETATRHPRARHYQTRHNSACCCASLLARNRDLALASSSGYAGAAHESTVPAGQCQRAVDGEKCEYGTEALGTRRPSTHGPHTVASGCAESLRGEAG
eukprot:2022022-Prymnesium_polylepis.2